MVSCAHSYRSIPLRHTPLHTYSHHNHNESEYIYNVKLVTCGISQQQQRQQHEHLSVKAIDDDGKSYYMNRHTHIRGRTCSLLLRRFFSFAFDFDYWWIDGWTSRRTNDDNRRYHIAHMCYNSATTKVIRWILLLSSTTTYFGESESERDWRFNDMTWTYVQRWSAYLLRWLWLWNGRLENVCVCVRVSDDEIFCVDKIVANDECVDEECDSFLCRARTHEKNHSNPVRCEILYMHEVQSSLHSTNSASISNLRAHHHRSSYNTLCVWIAWDDTLGKHKVLSLLVCRPLYCILIFGVNHSLPNGFTWIICYRFSVCFSQFKKNAEKYGLNWKYIRFSSPLSTSSPTHNSIPVKSSANRNIWMVPMFSFFVSINMMNWLLWFFCGSTNITIANWNHTYSNFNFARPSSDVSFFPFRSVNSFRLGSE